MFHFRLGMYAIVFVLLCFGKAEALLLRDNLQSAQTGDYLVVSFNKTDTVMLMHHKNEGQVKIEEITIPSGGKPPGLSWRDWVLSKAPGNQSWIIYTIDLNSGKMLDYYSFTKKNWYEIPEADHFLSKLLSLNFMKVPDHACKKVGPKPFSGPDWRQPWKPKMIVEGRQISGVSFEVWKTKWPKDGTQLSGRMIEIYLPKEHQLYPSYFPYWLQIQGVFGKAKIRIIDSGSGLSARH